jgi:RecB family endonuclease NucS
MKLYTHFSANNVLLKEMPFKRELAMEAYLIENESILKLNEDDLGQVQIISDELTINKARNEKSTDGRIDLLALYNNYGFGIIELKNGTLTKEHLEQLKDYFNGKEQIIDKFCDYFDGNKNNFKWIGILVGTGIDDDLLKLIEDEKEFIQDNIPIAAIVIKRYRSENNSQIFITSDTYISQKKIRDYTKYKFNNNEYGKSRLVLAVVKEYVNNNPKLSLQELQEVFEKKLQGSYGVIDTYSHAEEIYKKRNIERHFISPDDIIQLSNGQKIAVCNEWGRDNIDNFIQVARERGYYKIEPVKNT